VNEVGQEQIELAYGNADMVGIDAQCLMHTLG
jgi:hypothetical protein